MPDVTTELLLIWNKGNIYNSIWLEAFVAAKCSKIFSGHKPRQNGTLSLHHHEGMIPWWWRQRGPLKCWTIVPLRRGWSPEKILLYIVYNDIFATLLLTLITEYHLHWLIMPTWAWTEKSIEVGYFVLNFYFSFIFLH